MENELKVYADHRHSPVRGALKEVTGIDGIDNPFFLTRPFNPDQIYQKRGNYTIYEDMRNDDQISTCLDLKKDLILGAGFIIEPGEEGQEDIAKELKNILDNDLIRSFTDYLEEILDSIDMGFSLTEKIFRVKEDGFLTLKDLRTRHPGAWIIHTDNKGNIEKYEQQTGFGSVFIKPSDNKLIHMINRPKYLNPYGKSDMRPAFEAYISKREAIKYLDMYLERSASPKPVGKYPVNAKDGIAAKLAKILKSFQAKTSITIPEGVQVEFLEAKTNGEAFHKAINLFNMLIGRALLTPDLMGFTGSETAGGSFALGSEQLSTQYQHIKRKRQALEDIINKEVMRPLIIWNYGLLDNMPKFKLVPTREVESKMYAELFLKAVNGSTYVPSDEEINHFRTLIKFPEGDVERVVVAKPQPPFGNPNDPFDPDKPDDTNSLHKPGEEIELEVKDKFSRCYALDDESKKIQDKVDTKKIGKFMDSSVDSLLNEIQPLIDSIWDDMANQIEKKKIIQKKDLGLARMLKFKNLKTLNSIYQKNFKNVHKQGFLEARKEIMNPKTFASSTPLTDEEFIKVVNDETFDFVGDYSDSNLKSIRIKLSQSIKDGVPLSKALADIDELKDVSKVALERYARTKTTEIFNKGRLAFFDNSEAVDGYQYSAVLDGRTTAICAGLHGKKFKKGTQPVPPMHFSCRSLLIPITIFEPFTPDTSVGGEVETTKGDKIRIKRQPIDKHIEEFKGAGFPTQ